MKQVKQTNLLLFIFLLIATFSLNAQVGIGTTPAASAQLDVSSTTKGFLPPRMTSAQIADIIAPVEGLMVFNTTSKKPNYFDGGSWRNFDGSIAFSIGDNYKGGKIAYILQPSDPGYDANVTHGLIAATSDQSSGVEWGCILTTIPGVFGTALGTGNQNTINIMAGCSTAGIAARLCGDLVLNGYNDWYLPSSEELNKLYINRIAVGGFTNNIYWSSSQSSDIFAFARFFAGGGLSVVAKSTLFPIRAVRAF